MTSRSHRLPRVQCKYLKMFALPTNEHKKTAPHAFIIPSAVVDYKTDDAAEFQPQLGVNDDGESDSVNSITLCGIALLSSDPVWAELCTFDEQSCCDRLLLHAGIFRRSRWEPLPTRRWATQTFSLNYRWSENSISDARNGTGRLCEGT